VATIRRLRLVRAAVPIVLSGGVFQAEDPDFHARLWARILAGVPRAQIARLRVPPVVGAALLGLDRLTAPTAAGDRLRIELTEARLTPTS
jgi:hypothetical protein